MVVERCEANGLTLAYETFGDPRLPPLVLIAGLGAQMLAWPDELCGLLAEHRHVVRFDNRDAGESTHLDAPKPDIQACLAGDTSSAAYKIDDMARDVVGLLDALSIESAHVVGASLGGMIAQMVAALHPERVRSLTSIMSTTGARAVSQPTPEASAMLLHPPARTREEAMEWAVRVNSVIGSPAYPSDEAEVRALAAGSWDRGYDPHGFARQFAAILTSRNRTEAVRTIRAPTLVIHGEADPLVPVAGGPAPTEPPDGAQLDVFAVTANTMPRQHWADLCDQI